MGSGSRGEAQCAPPALHITWQLAPQSHPAPAPESATAEPSGDGAEVSQSASGSRIRLALFYLDTDI